MLIEKEFPEIQNTNENNNEKWMQPLPVLKGIVLQNLEMLRKGMENPNQVKLNYQNKIIKNQYSTEGFKRSISISVYYSNKEVCGKRPLFYFIHGGAFIGGSSEINDNFMRLIADRTNAIVASIDYNRAPEARYPEALNDCYKGLMYLLNQKEIAEIDETKITIAGDSAGGNLAAALNLKLADEGKVKGYRQILFYPITSFKDIVINSSKKTKIECLGMQKIIELSRELYLNDTTEIDLPYVSPLETQINSQLPDTLILVAERDGLKDNGINYGTKLEENGVNVRTILYKGAAHAFLNNLGKSAVADDSAEEVLEFIK